MFSSADDTTASSFLPTHVFLRVDTMSMMPPGGVGRIDRKLIHRSAWKGNSAKYVPQQRRFWSEASLLALLSLRTSRGMKGGLQFSE
jgi:hypothetical protein